MNYGYIEDSVLSRMYYKGATKEDFIREADEGDRLYHSGELHYRHYVERRCCAEYVESEDFARESELYSKLVDIFKPLQDREIVWFFTVEFIDSDVHVDINYDVDYEENHEDLNRYVKADFDGIIAAVADIVSNLD